MEAAHNQPIYHMDQNPVLDGLSIGNFSEELIIHTLSHLPKKELIDPCLSINTFFKNAVIKLIKSEQYSQLLACKMGIANNINQAIENEKLASSVNKEKIRQYKKVAQEILKFTTTNILNSKNLIELRSTVLKLEYPIIKILTQLPLDDLGSRFLNVQLPKLFANIFDVAKHYNSSNPNIYDKGMYLFSWAGVYLQLKNNDAAEKINDDGFQLLSEQLFDPQYVYIYSLGVRNYYLLNKLDKVRKVIDQTKGLEKYQAYLQTT